MTSQKHSYPILDSRFSILDEHRVSGIEHRVYRAQPNGLTLIELLVSIAVTSILMLAIGSAMLVATRAMPNANGPANQIIVASDVAEQLATELQYATTINDSNATMIEFTVADRDTDEVPETIRYEWSGIAGDPLTRQYNGGTAVMLAEDVQEFNLNYFTRGVTTTEMQTITTRSGDILLAFFEGWPSVPSPSSGFQSVNQDCWAAEFFTIGTLPGNATKLEITSVELQLQQSTLGAAGTFSVGIHRCQGGGNPEPSPTPIGTPVVRSSSTLDPSSFLWEQFTFSDIVINNPKQEYVIVVKGSDPSGTSFDADVLYYFDSSAPTDDTMALWTTNAGSQWDPNKSRRDRYDFLFRVYGSYETTSDEQVEVTRYFLSSINIKLRLGSDPATRVDGGVQALNAPEVPTP